MHILQIPEGISEPVPTVNGRLLEAGRDYICTNAFAGLMLMSRWKVIVNGEIWSLRKLLRSYSIDFAPFDPEENWNGKDVWLYRGGGWGDLLMLTPLIREIRNMWPFARIHVACGKIYHPLFIGLDVICEELPIPYDRQTKIDAMIEFEELIEGDPIGNKLHMVDLFAHKAGITVYDRKPEYHVTKEERTWAAEKYPTTNIPRVGIQLLASAFYRTYPKMIKVMTELAKTTQVFLFGTPGQIELEKPIDNVVNLMADKLKFRESAALVSTCDVCVSPDSALVHVCSALDVPCVCLYGPFPSSLRITSREAVAIEGKAPCAPCFFHADAPDQFPIGQPCTDCKTCVALESIEVGDVVSEVQELILRILPSEPPTQSILQP